MYMDTIHTTFQTLLTAAYDNYAVIL